MGVVEVQNFNHAAVGIGRGGDVLFWGPGAPPRGACRCCAWKKAVVVDVIP
jgi:hypothetical protein